MHIVVAETPSLGKHNDRSRLGARVQDVMEALLIETDHTATAFGRMCSSREAPGHHSRRHPGARLRSHGLSNVAALTDTCEVGREAAAAHVCTPTSESGAYAILSYATDPVDLRRE